MIGRCGGEGSACGQLCPTSMSATKDGVRGRGWGLPGLGFPSGHALPQPLGVRGQVVDQLPADLVGGLDGVRILQDAAEQRVCSQSKM